MRTGRLRDQDRQARRPACSACDSSLDGARASHECSAGIRCRSDRMTSRLRRIFARTSTIVERPARRPMVALCRSMAVRGSHGMTRGGRNAEHQVIGGTGIARRLRCGSLHASNHDGGCAIHRRARRRGSRSDRRHRIALAAAADRSGGRRHASSGRTRSRGAARRTSCRCCNGSRVWRSSRTADPAQRRAYFSVARTRRRHSF